MVRFKMQTVNASTFKAKCLALMDEVARTGKPVLVTKNGKPIAELRPHVGKRPLSSFGVHKGWLKSRATSFRRSMLNGKRSNDSA